MQAKPVVSFTSTGFVFVQLFRFNAQLSKIDLKKKLCHKGQSDSRPGIMKSGGHIFSFFFAFFGSFKAFILLLLLWHQTLVQIHPY